MSEAEVEVKVEVEVEAEAEVDPGGGRVPNLHDRKLPKVPRDKLLNRNASPILAGLVLELQAD